MQQELPNLVDERRFRKREPDYERDELGRVSTVAFSRYQMYLPVAAQVARSEDPNRYGEYSWFQLTCPGRRSGWCLRQGMSMIDIVVHCANRNIAHTK